MSELKQIQDKTMPYWDIVRDYFPLDESGLQLDDIAYINVVRCRMRKRPNGDYFRPSTKIKNACVKNHFVGWLDWLRPRVVVCIGKWAHDNIAELLEERGVDHEFINRERSLPRAKRREDQKLAAALIQGNTEQGIRRMNKRELAALIERKELDIGNPSKQKLAKTSSIGCRRNVSLEQSKIWPPDYRSVVRPQSNTTTGQSRSCQILCNLVTFNSYVLFALIVLPLAGAVVLLTVPGERRLAIRWVATVVAFVVMLLSMYVFVGHTDFGAPRRSMDEFVGQTHVLRFEFERTWDWLDLIPQECTVAASTQSGSMDCRPSIGGGPSTGSGQALRTGHRALGVDGISALMVMLTGIVMFTGVLVSWNITHRSKDFFILYFLLLSGVFGVFVSLDLFFLFFFYELAVLPMYLLIGVWGSSSDFRTFVRTKEYGAMKLMLYLVAGSVLIWIALIAIFAQADLGTFNFVALHEYGELPDTFQRIFFPFLMVGFGVLAGMWPFHTWSPDGHVAAPTAVSMVHAGVLMKLGAYGILRVGMGLMPRAPRPGCPCSSGSGRSTSYTAQSRPWASATSSTSSATPA